MSDESIAEDTARRVRTLLDEGRLTEAATLLDDVEAIGASKRALILARAAYIERTDGAHSAIAHLEAVIEKRPDDAGLALDFSRFLKRKGHQAKATEVLARCVQRTSNPWVVRELLELELDRANPAGAERVLLSAPQLGETDPQWHIHAVRLAARLHGTEEALARAEAAVQAFPAHAVVQSDFWGLLIRAGRRREAEAACLAYAEASTEDMKAQVTAARFLNESGSRDSCDALLSRLSKHLPRDAEILRALATIHISRADVLEARRLLKHLPDEDAETPENMRLLARIDGALGDHAAVLDRRRRLFALYPDDADARYELASAHATLGEHEAAETLALGLPDTLPRHRIQRHLLLAELALDQGRHADALSELDALLALDPDHLRALQARSDAALFLGQLDSAWKTHAKATVLHADRDLSGRARTKLRNSSLRGHILNEFRLQATPDLLEYCAATVDSAEALAAFHRTIENEPGNTAAALSLFGMLRRMGRISGDRAPGPSIEAEAAIPKVVYQFWDSPEPPKQVQWLMDQNKEINPDYSFRRFNQAQAIDYLSDRGDQEILRSFRIAHLPAVKADIFRLALLWHEGGIYLDADDRCTRPLDRIIDHRLRFIGYQEAPRNIGNNFLAVRPGDPIIEAALEDAVAAYGSSLGEVAWLATGPGAVTRALARHGTTEAGELKEGIWIMPESRLRNVISPHIRISYKTGATHWQREFQRSPNN